MGVLSLIKGVSHTKEVLPAFFIMKEAGGSFCFKCQSGISYLVLVKSHVTQSCCMKEKNIL